MRAKADDKTRVKASVGDLVYTRGDLKVVISEMRFVPSNKPVKDIVYSIG